MHQPRPPMHQVVSHIGGKLLLFQAAVPSLGPGTVKNREQPNLYGTDREYSLRVPDDPVRVKTEPCEGCRD